MSPVKSLGNSRAQYNYKFGLTGLEAANPYVPAIVYVDDVFSTDIIPGTGDSNQTAANGIDLLGKGGMVWGKDRVNGVVNTFYHNNFIWDSERPGKYLSPNLDLQEDHGGTVADVSFLSNGYNVGLLGQTNCDYVGWTFRKQPGFLDIVTYEGDGNSGKIVPHSLGSTPGFVMIKRLDVVDSRWICWHRSTNTAHLVLSATEFAGESYNNYFTVDASNITINNSAATTNTDGSNYVAYLFAHDDQRFGTDRDESIIKCGSVTTNSSGEIPDVNLGFEPQFLLIKSSDITTQWYLYDSMRGMPVGSNESVLYPNLSNAEGAGANTIELTSTGFKGGPDSITGTTSNLVYMAIRRPHKPKTVGTDVFMPYSVSPGEGQDTLINVGFDVDFFLYRKTGGGPGGVIGDRMRGKSGGGDLLTSDPQGEGTNAGAFFLDQSRSVTVDYEGGHTSAAPAATDESYVRYFFKRAPEFFDIVAYKGNAVSGRQIPHNLQAEPEMIWVKNRNPSSNGNAGWDWMVYVKDLGNTGYLRLNSQDGESNNNQNWNSTTPTSTHFTIGNGVYTNENDSEFIAYLFGSLPGVSKIGTYSNESTSVVHNIDCGFNSPARFVMIKRYDSGMTHPAQGQWAVWDSARGIGTGNDSYVSLNTTDAEVTGFDDISTFSSGFTVNVESANTSGYFNVSNASYIYLAIA